MNQSRYRRGDCTFKRAACHARQQEGGLKSTPKRIAQADTGGCKPSCRARVQMQLPVLPPYGGSHPVRVVSGAGLLCWPSVENFKHNVGLDLFCGLDFFYVFLF